MLRASSLALTIALAASGAAADAPGLRERIVLGASVRLRGESIDWFRPASSSADESYRFFASQVRVGARVTFPHLQAVLEVQDTRLFDLPDDAGNLGPGATYFAHTPHRDQGETFLKQAYVTLRRSGLAASLGRMEYADGLETLPGDRTLAWLKRSRIAERLVGPFGYTHVTRSLDALKLVWDRPAWNATAFAGIPTQGGYEISANRELDDVSLAGLALTAKALPAGPPVDLRAFWLSYRDARDEPTKVDNSGLAAFDEHSISLHTLGGHALTVLEAGPGALDALAWFAFQTGDWGRQDHRARAHSLELGYQLTRVRAAPWLRVGWNRSTGDESPSDADHRTFFQILPTPRIYGQLPFYNLMNSDDLFAQLILQPHPLLNLRLDFHWLHLADASDLWYAGGGASNREIFGFSGTSSGGKRALANLADLGVSLGPWRRFSLYAYYGHAFGRDVVRDFRDEDADYFYLDLMFRY